MKRVAGLTFVGMAVALSTGLMTNALAGVVPLWLLFSLSTAGIFASGYFAGRRDELRSTIKDGR